MAGNTNGLQQQEITIQQIQENLRYYLNWQFFNQTIPDVFSSEESLFNKLTTHAENLQKLVNDNKISKEECSRLLNQPFTAVVVTSTCENGKIDPTKSNATDETSLDIDCLVTLYKIYPTTINNETTYIQMQNPNSITFNGFKKHIAFKEIKNCPQVGEDITEAKLRFFVELIKFNDFKTGSSDYKNLMQGFNNSIKGYPLKNFFRGASCFWMNNRIKNFNPTDFENYKSELSSNYRDELVVSCFDLISKNKQRNFNDSYIKLNRSILKTSFKEELKNKNTVAIPHLDLRTIIEYVNDPNFKLTPGLPEDLVENINKMIKSLKEIWNGISIADKKIIEKHYNLKKELQAKNIDIFKNKKYLELSKTVSNIYSKKTNVRNVFSLITDQIDRPPFILKNSKNWKDLDESEIITSEQIYEESKNNTIKNKIPLGPEAQKIVLYKINKEKSELNKNKNQLLLSQPLNQLQK